NLETRNETRTIELKIKVSKSIDSEGEEIDNRIFDVNLTVLKLPETSIKDKTFDKTLREFKKLIGYTSPTVAIKNFESHFEVNGGIVGAQYFITNLETKSVTETIELKVKVSKSIDSIGEEVENKIINVNLTTSKDWTYEMYEISNDGILSVKDTASWDYANWDGKLFIPREINEKKIKIIGLSEFNKRFALQISNKVVSLEFEEDIELEKINNFAFSDCTNLQGELKLPQTLTSIGEDAFYNCWKLEGELILPETLTLIGSRAFFNCLSFTGNLVIPNLIQKIEKDVFNGCKGIDGVLTLPRNLTSIGESAFWGCSNLSGTLTIPNSVQSIGSYAFKGAEGIASISVLNKLYQKHNTTWSQGYWNNELDEGSNVINLEADKDIVEGMFSISPNGVLSIADISMWDYNSWNGELTIPKEVQGRTVKKIISGNGSKNFSTQIKSKLNSLTFESQIQLTEIGDFAFYMCSSLSGELKLPSSLTNLGSSSFEGCSELSGNLVIPNSINSIPQNAFNGCSGFDGTLTLPSKLMTIDTMAFFNCEKLIGDLEMPESVITMSDNIFGNCFKINSITVSDDLFKNHQNVWSQFYWNQNEGFKSNVINRDGPVYTEMFSLTRNGTLSINDISQWDYENWDGVLTIPKEINGIKVFMIKTSNKLEESFSVQIKEKLNTLIFESGIEVIGSFAFYNCSQLAGNLVLPNSIDTIGDRAFENCSGISALTLPNEIDRIYRRAFYGTSGLRGDLIIPDTIKKIEAQSFYKSGFDGTLTLPKTLETIESSAFYALPNLKSIAPLPPTLKIIQDSAFRDCDELSGDIDIPESVTSIGQDAFFRCNKISSITVSEELFINHKTTWSQNFAGKVINRDAKIDGIFATTSNGTLSITDISQWDYENWDGVLTIPKEVKGVKIKETVDGDSKNNFISQVKGKLKTIIFEEGIELERIGSYSFGEFTSSTFDGQITLPKSLKVIGASAFYKSSAFKGSLVLPENLILIQDRAFQECTGFRGNLIIPNSVTKIYNYAFYRTEFDGSLILSNSLLQIGVWTFQKCYYIKGDLQIPPSVTSIGNSAFSGSNGITSITVSDKLFQNHATVWSEGYGGKVINRGYKAVIENFESPPNGVFATTDASHQDFKNRNNVLTNRKKVTLIKK
ncbi:MAG: leucine-rich repeat domain-containing protein, partial [Mycoplasma sp.]